MVGQRAGDRGHGTTKVHSSGLCEINHQAVTVHASERVVACVASERVAATGASRCVHGVEGHLIKVVGLAVSSFAEVKEHRCSVVGVRAVKRCSVRNRSGEVKHQGLPTYGRRGHIRLYAVRGVQGVFEFEAHHRARFGRPDFHGDGLLRWRDQVGAAGL